MLYSAPACGTICSIWGGHRIVSHTRAWRNTYIRGVSREREFLILSSFQRCRYGRFGYTQEKEEKTRNVMEVLSNSSTISEICRKYNVASSAGTAAMEHGRSTVEASLTREINELKGISVAINFSQQRKNMTL